jgi:ribosomal protein S18 acetylase RimI-like enzyme
MSGRSLPARLKPYFRFGTAAGLLAIGKRLARSWLEWGSVVVFELPIVKSQTVGADLVVRTATRAELPLLGRVFNRPVAELAERLDRGDRGFVGWQEGQPVHIRWITTRPTEIPELGLWLWPDPGTIYIYDAGTAPAARGHGLSRRVGAAMDDALAADGVRAKVAYARGDNHTMWHALRGVPGPLVIRCRLYYARRPGRPPRVLGAPRAPVGPRPRAATLSATV